jgi:integrase
VDVRSSGRPRAWFLLVAAPHVVVNIASGKPYTVNGFRHTFDRAACRAGIVPGDDVTLHNLRRTDMSR